MSKVRKIFDSTGAGAMSPAAEIVARRARISGRVQGVWFRGWTRERALALGLAGWVRNLPDGRVEALFIGPPDKVAEMLDACRDGPDHARVSAVESAPVEPPPALEGFEIRR